MTSFIQTKFIPTKVIWEAKTSIEKNTSIRLACGRVYGVFS